MLLALFMTCTPLPLASSLELRDFKLGTRALLAKDAVALALQKSGTDRHNLAVELFPYVVDKDNWPTPQASGLPARTQIIQRNELQVGDHLVVGPLVPPTLGPHICLQLARIPAKDFDALTALLRAESSSRTRLELLKANQRNWMFDATQIAALKALLRYREEQSELDTLLRPAP